MNGPTSSSSHAARANVMSCLANDELHLILMATEACNFRCTYCYEDFHYSRMQPQVVRGVKRLLARRSAGLRLLEIAWFGGEPLLAMDVIEDVSRHARSLQQRHPSMRYVGGITTNAYTLDRRRFEHLLDLGVTRFQIAFDGPRECHDRNRVTAGGLGTFDRTWAHVRSMRGVDRDFRVVVRLHVDRDNASSLPAFIRDYARTFGADHRFTLFIRTLGRLGGPNDATLPVFEDGEGRKVVQKLSDHAQRLGAQHVTIEQHTPICYAARGNSYVVRANGRLNKCTVALEHSNNQVGTLSEDGLLELDQGKMKNWMRGVWSGDREQLECPMLGYADDEEQRSVAPASGRSNRLTLPIVRSGSPV